MVHGGHGNQVSVDAVSSGGGNYHTPHLQSTPEQSSCCRSRGLNCRRGMNVGHLGKTSSREAEKAPERVLERKRLVLVEVQTGSKSRLGLVSGHSVRQEAAKALAVKLETANTSMSVTWRRLLFVCRTRSLYVRVESRGRTEIAEQRLCFSQKTTPSNRDLMIAVQDAAACHSLQLTSTASTRAVASLFTCSLLLTLPDGHLQWLAEIRLNTLSQDQV